MSNAPRLIDVSTPLAPVGNVVVLHGGASRGVDRAVSPRQASVLRMVPIARRIARAGRGRLAVTRLLNATRGWRGDRTPVDDVFWALDRLAEREPGALPVCLVGHSLGGRAALLAGARPEVRSVVALAPWVYPDDVAAGLEGREILIVHGTDDRIASPSRSAALAERLGRSNAVTFVAVDGGKHAMLGHHAAFTRPAAEFAMTTLDTADRLPAPATLAG